MLTLLQDDFPLASLPLLGYAVDMPATEDNIQKDFVFKLQFKNHVYFFRAESQFTYERSACLSYILYTLHSFK
jgi:FERM/RhoGEF/pleckstrin domain protein 2